MRNVACCTTDRNQYNVDVIQCNTTSLRHIVQMDYIHKEHKKLVYEPPQRFAPCRLDFDTPLSYVTTLPQSPLTSRPHSWLPSTNPPYFLYWFLYTFSLPFFSPSLFPPSPPTTFLPLSRHSYNMPIQLLYRPVLHYIQLYGLDIVRHVMPIQLPCMTQY